MDPDQAALLLLVSLQIFLGITMTLGLKIVKHLLFPVRKPEPEPGEEEDREEEDEEEEEDGS